MNLVLILITLALIRDSIIPRFRLLLWLALYVVIVISRKFSIVLKYVLVSFSMDAFGQAGVHV